MSREGVLLLGGAGFIGSALASRLRQEGVLTYLLGRNHLDEFEGLLPRCRTIVHLASSTTPGASASQPHLELANVELTVRLLQLLQNQSQIHLIFFSSGGTVYGNPKRLPVREDARIAPLSYHGAGKAAQEMFFEAARRHGHAVTILRPSNAYGPGQSLRAGFGLIRTLLEHAYRGTTLEIWGDGEQVRDYIYIDDIVEATVRLIARPTDSDTYNLGSGDGYSIKQVKDAVEAATGKKVGVNYRPARGGDVHRIVLDNRRMRDLLGWQPAVTLEDGIRRTWTWMQQT